MYQIFVYVPASHVSQVLHALFTAGAGQLGMYRNCCWQTRGIGQFCPQAGSKPFSGIEGQLEQTEEIKIEVICSSDCLQSALKAMIVAHPYEIPAYGAIKLTFYEGDI